MRFLLRLAVIVLVNALGLWLAARYITGFIFNGTVSDLVVTAIIFTLLNALLKPVLKLILSPVIILTLGLAMFVINAFVLHLLDILSGNLRIEGITALLLATLLLSVVNFVSHIIAR